MGFHGAGEMAQQIRALANLPEDPGSIPRTHLRKSQASCHMVAIPALGKQKRADPQGSLVATLAYLARSIQGDTLSQNEVMADT